MWNYQRHLRTLWNVWLLVFSALCVVPLTTAQAQQAPVFNDAELQQMLAPIALYPDDLLSQVLTAASYPIDVVEAQRFVSNNPSMSTADAVNAADQTAWDPSVKSLVAFPGILQTMSTNLQWTQRLGQANVSQQAQVMATVQLLRRRAYEVGNLSSSNQVQVLSSGNYITITTDNPEVIFMPYYNPLVIYGNWWWPQYPPMAWAPWPGYRDSFGATVQWGNAVWVNARWQQWRRVDRGRLSRPAPSIINQGNTAAPVQVAPLHRDARDLTPVQPRAISPAPAAQPTHTGPRPPEAKPQQAHEGPEPCIKGNCAADKDTGHGRSNNDKSRPDK